MSDDPRNGPRRRLLTRRAIGVIAALAGCVDGWLVHRPGVSAGRLLVSSVFMVVFVAVTLTAFTRARRAYRPDNGQRTDDRPTAGGWARPTTAQRVTARIERAFTTWSRNR